MLIFIHKLIASISYLFQVEVRMQEKLKVNTNQYLKPPAMRTKDLTETYLYASQRIIVECLFLPLCASSFITIRGWLKHSFRIDQSRDQL